MPLSRPLAVAADIHRRLGDGPALVLLALLVVTAPQLLGGVYPWGMLALAAAALCALALTLFGARRRGPSPTPLGIAMLLAWAWTVLQASPLPCWLVARVAADSATQLERVHQLLGWARPIACTLSRDPGATREEVVKGIAICASFFAASMLSRRGHARLIFAAVAASGVVLALVSAMHVVAGATRVFGIYAPLEIQNQPFLSPVLNPNACGGFLAMCCPLLAGLAMSEQNPGRRLLILAATGLVAASAFATRSRGAVGAFVFGMTLLISLMWFRRRRGAAAGSARQPWWPKAAPVALAAVIGLAAYNSYAEVVHEFRIGSWDKLDLVRTVLRFAVAHPWLGIGRGAFGSVFASTYGSLNRFVYAENFVAQWITEWGFPISVLLLAALGHAWARAIFTARSAERIGAVAGLTAIGAQNLVDLGFELVGVSLVASVLLGATVTQRSRGSRRAPSTQRWRFAVAATVLTAVMLIVLSPRLAQDHAAYLQQRLQSDLQAGRTGISKPMQHALLAHPSDPTFATLAAAERLAHREPRPGRWINRALQLAPGWVAPHLLATQWLWNSGHPSQALIELAAALDIDPANSRAVLCSIARFELDPVLPLAAAGRRGTEALEILAGCFEPTSSAAGQVDAAILAHSPDDASASVRQAQRLLSAGDAASAQALAERALEHAGTPAQITSACLVQARALMAMERFDEATALLQNVERKLDTPTSLVVLEAEIAAQRGDEALTVATIDRLRGLAEGDPAMTASAFMLEGALQRRLGNPASAMRAYDQAYGLTRNPSALRNIAEISRQLGNLARAVWAYGELCTTAQGNQDACNMRKTLINTQPERSREAAQPIQR